MLQAQVIVQVAGQVFLYTVNGVRCGRGLFALGVCRFGAGFKIAFGAVWGQSVFGVMAGAVSVAFSLHTLA